MSAIQTTITLTHGKEQIQTIKDKLLKDPSVSWHQFVAIRNYFHSLIARDRSAKAVVQVNSGDAVASTGTVTLSSLAAADTITVGSQTFTASSSPSGNNQFLVTGGDTLAAAAAAAKIAAHPNLSPYLTASAASGVITVTALVGGEIGNNIPIAISAHGSVSGSGKLTSGANATTYSSTNTYHAGV